jgi:hypothetical protein
VEELLLVEYVGGAGAEVGGMEVDVEHMVEKDAVVVIGCCWSGSVCWLDAFLGCFQVFCHQFLGRVDLGCVVIFARTTATLTEEGPSGAVILGQAALTAKCLEVHVQERK